MNFCDPNEPKKHNTFKMASNRLLFSALKSRALYNVQSTGTRRFSEVVRPTKPVTPAERLALRAARKERASKLLNTESTASSGGRGFVGNKYFWYASVIIPSGILVWGFRDENSPPAKFAEMIGLTGFLSKYIDDIAKPSHEKLLPDWSQVRNFFGKFEMIGWTML